MVVVVNPTIHNIKMNVKFYNVTYNVKCVVQTEAKCISVSVV